MKKTYMFCLKGYKENEKQEAFIDDYVRFIIDCM